MNRLVNEYWDNLSHSKQKQLIEKYSIRVEYFISFQAKEFIYNRENNK